MLDKPHKVPFIAFVLYLFLCLPAWGFGLFSFSGGSGATAAGGGAACTTPNNGSVIDEGFIGTDNSGYENTGWTEVIASGTVEPDFTLTDGTDTDSCTEGLQVYFVDDATYTRWDKGSVMSQTSDYDAVFHVYIPTDSLAFAAYRAVNIIQFTTSTNAYNYQWSIQLKNNSGTAGTGGTYVWIGSGDSNTGNTAVTFDSWETLTIHCAASSTDCSLKVNDGSADTFTEKSGFEEPQYLSIGGVRNVYSGDSGTIEVGYLYVNVP